MRADGLRARRRDDRDSRAMLSGYWKLGAFVVLSTAADASDQLVSIVGDPGM